MTEMHSDTTEYDRSLAGHTGDDNEDSADASKAVKNVSMLTVLPNYPIKPASLTATHLTVPTISSSVANDTSSVPGRMSVGGLDGSSDYATSSGGWHSAKHAMHEVVASAEGTLRSISSSGIDVASCMGVKAFQEPIDGHYFWEIAGPALNIKQSIENDITRIRDDNDEMFDPEKDCTWELWVQGKSEKQAFLTVRVVGSSKLAREALVQLLRKRLHQRYADWKITEGEHLAILFDLGRLAFETQDSSIFTTTSTDGLIIWNARDGTASLIQNTTTSKQSFSTICGPFQLHDRKLFLTSAHIFTDTSPFDDLIQGDHRCDHSSHHPDNDSDAHTNMGSNRSGTDDDVVHRDRGFADHGASSPAAVPNQAQLGVHRGETGQPGETGAESITQGLVKEQEPALHLNVLHGQRHLDYAMIDLGLGVDPDLEQMNTAEWSVLEQTDRHPPKHLVMLRTAQRGDLKGRFLSSPITTYNKDRGVLNYWMFQPEHEFPSEASKQPCKIQPGDSGALVRGQGRIYGMIIAGSLSTNTAVVVPYYELLRDIERMMTASHDKQTTSASEVVPLRSHPEIGQQVTLPTVEMWRSKQRTLQYIDQGRIGSDQSYVLHISSNPALVDRDDQPQENAGVVSRSRVSLPNEPEQVDMLTSIETLALMHSERGRYVEAQALLFEVLKIRQTNLGDEDLDTLASMGNLALTYIEQGQYAIAEEMLSSLLETTKRVLGDAHPYVLMSMADLAVTYIMQGRHKEAETTEEALSELLSANKDTIPDAKVIGCREPGLNWKDHYYNALDAASKRGHLGVVKLLMQNEVYSDADTLGPRIVMQAASEQGHLELVKLVLQSGTGFSAQYEGDLLRNALRAASRQGHLGLVEFLLQSGAEVNARNRRSRVMPALSAASGQGHLAVVKLLLQNGAVDNLEPYSPFTKTALQAAAEEGYLEVVKLLLQSGFYVKAGTPSIVLCTALYAASDQGDLELVELLLQSGADVNLHGRDDVTALKAASGQGHHAVVKLLLQSGANVNAHGRGAATALEVASGQGHLEVVKLLLANGAHLRGCSEANAFQAAANGGHLVVMRVLLDEAADVDRERYLHNALQGASPQGQGEILRLLMDQGANINND